MTNKASSRILFLRATLKIFTALAFIWLAYIFTSGLFDYTGSEDNEFSVFILPSISKEGSVYYKLDNREILAVNHQGKFFIYWAYDPIYGCRLEYENLIIKPVCINIEYNLDGYNSDKTQQLLSPDYKINSENELIIY